MPARRPKPAPVPRVKDGAIAPCDHPGCDALVGAPCIRPDGSARKVFHSERMRAAERLPRPERPGPQTPAGRRSETIQVKVTPALLERVETARGEQSRSDWTVQAIGVALELEPDAVAITVARGGQALATWVRDAVQQRLRRLDVALGGRPYDVAAGGT